MKALHHKLLRDLRTLWSQALTIALVVASGVAGFVTTLSAVDSLDAARERFYAEGRFADAFVALKRAPRALQDSLLALPGVADVQATVEMGVRVSLPGRSDPVVGHLVGLDARHAPRLNRVLLHDGSAAPSPGPEGAGGELPAWVSEAFARAHGLGPGARLQALVNGRQRTLVLRGVALAPEYVFAGLWGMPDQRGFGVFWVDAEALAAAVDMAGAFNHLAVRLAPGAELRAVLAALDATLAPYGAQPAIGREHQTSHAMLDAEIEEQRVLGSLLPVIFLAVAAFLLNVVVSRLVTTQREQIAALKALGYDNRAIAAHYLQLVGAIVALGLLLGLALGKALGLGLMALYADFFRFPVLEHRLSPGLALGAAALVAATAVAGTLGAIAATVRLAPAEAMRPPAPGRYRRTLAERLGAERLALSLRMILRQVERRPWRSTLAVAGVAASIAIVVMGNFFRDAIEFIVDSNFNLGMRSDVAVWTMQPVDAAAGQALLRLPGARELEATRFVPVRLVNGHVVEQGQIRGYATVPSLYRIVGMDGRAVAPDGPGLVLTDRLARKLGLRVGDRVRVEVLEGRRPVLQLPVDALVSEMMGLNAYMGREALNRALGDGDLANGFVVTLEPGREAAFLEATRGLPLVAGAFSKATMLANMQELSARNVRIMSTVLTAFAVVIAVGVVYNNARIALAERAWELASLRVLGFTRGEVSALLLGELALVVLVALPLGMAAGWALVHALAGALASDQFAFPVVIRPRTYAWAALAVLAAALASAAVVRRHVDRLDMVSALKTRE